MKKFKYQKPEYEDLKIIADKKFKKKFITNEYNYFDNSFDDGIYCNSFDMYGRND